MIDDRRAGKFSERLSVIVIITAALGAFAVLVDPKITLTLGGQIIILGGDGFSSELKGAVITIMLIGGWTAVMNFWLGSSDGGQKQQQAIARIAEQSAPVSAAAVAAATGATAPTVPAKVDTINVAADTANIIDKGASP